MNVESFLRHYGIVENPFKAEEARQDAVFSRVEAACFHPDYAKIRGDWDYPASAIVFGERGSGKTAIRLQIEDELRAHNRANPDRRCLPLIYDELNPVLDRFHRRVRKGSAAETLHAFRLTDHIDAMMSAVVPAIVTQAIGEGREEDQPLESEASAKQPFRRLDASAKHDLMMLQVCYDRPGEAPQRTSRLKRAIRHRAINSFKLYRLLAGSTGVLTVVGLVYFLIAKPGDHVWLWYLTLGLLLLATVVFAGRTFWIWWKINGLARDLSRQLRVEDRSSQSFRESLLQLKAQEVLDAGLPRSEDDDLRYAMFKRLMNVLRPLGYRSMMVLVDRVDEPTLINGEPDLMRALVWPMLNNKFLQQDRVGVKLLLPLELRYALNRETGDFYRAARLDKQNLIERLVWSGATLYDICTARLNACRAAPTAKAPAATRDGERDGLSAGATRATDATEARRATDAGGTMDATADRISLKDMFEENVTYQDLVDALDQMQQPRDAFKFIYQLIQEHCSNVPEEHPQWKIPRPVLDSVRKHQVERMTGMLRGVRPA